MVKFFTLPPIEVPYPYVLLNARNPAIDYVIKYRGFIREVIIDSGVEIFRNPSVKDYPKGWFEHLASLFKRVKQLVPHTTVWATVPDYPDDYHPKSLWVDGKTNIERTLDNILYALSNYPEVNWLIPVQGHNSKPESVVYTLELYSRNDIPLDRYIAVANLCVERRDEVIVRTIKLVHSWLMKNGIIPKIHVFGPDISAIMKIKQYITSFDSTAWTKPRVSGYWSAKNSRERVWLFLTFIHRYAHLIELPYEVIE